MARQHGVTTNTSSRLVLDAGALYLDYDEGGQALIGATRGGATFTVEQEIREIEIDGALGPIKNLRRITRAVPKLTCTLLEMTLAQFKRMIPASASTSSAPHDVITRITNVLAAGDYLTNVAIVAEMSGQTNPVIVKVKNALFTGPFSLTTTDQDEGTIPVEVEGHYLDTDLDTEPWEIKFPQS